MYSPSRTTFRSTLPHRCLRRHHALLAAASLEGRPGKKVAIVGLGGLGHMGVKLAHAMGAEVTVLSQTLSKKRTA